MDKEQAKIGTKVVTNRSFSGVPEGTTGFVIEDYLTGVTIAWDLPHRPYPHDKEPQEIAAMYAVNPECPLRDGFSYDELIYLDICREISS